jgi:peptidoglycan/LPS O-acetylase OafA/YrhL
MAKNKNTKTETPTSSKGQFVFGKQNYLLLLIALAVVVIGFVLMYGKEGDIYDFRRTTLAPIVVLSGFVIGIFAIFKKSKGE